jgi:hypothetical protein
MTERVKETIVTRKDLRVDTFRAGGKGGQAQNKRDTGVRITHLPSGAVGESREERGQLENKRRAFRRMAQHWKFRAWLGQLFARDLPATSSTRRYTYRAPHISLENRKLDRE